MDFAARQNRDINTLPDGLEDMVRDRCSGFATYFSWLTKDSEKGLCEEIYGAKATKKGLAIQKLAVVSESGDYLFRNCFLGGITGNGFFSYGYDGKGRGVQGCWLQYDKDLVESSPDFYARCMSIRLFDMDRIVSLDPSLKWCAWNANLPIKFIDYIRLFRKHPQTVEFVSKLGLSRLLTERAMEEISKDRRLAIWISRHAQQIKGMALQTVRNAYRKNPNADPRDYANSLQHRIESGKACALRNKALYSRVLKHTTQERIARYLKDNRIDKSSYSDYLDACDWMKLDLSDTKVLFPHDFHALHHEYTRQYAKSHAVTDENMDKRMSEVADRFSYLGDFSGDGLCVIIARSKLDLIDEGSYLHHCVGKMRYDERQAKGESLICFIRKESEPAIPFVTAEVKIAEKTLRVAQCYGDHNHIVEEVKPFVDQWMVTSNRKLRKGMPIRA